MKRLKVLFCISILWFSASVLQPVPVDAELGVLSSGNWETVFEQAFSLNSFDQWQNFISENYIQMKTLWEEKMDAEISSIVASVTESDVVHSTDVYKDYILKYLQAQKDSLLRDWEADSEQQISGERNTFLGKLSGVYVSRSDASIPGMGQDYFSQLQIWGTNFQDTLNLGLSEFQTALSKIEQSYSELLEKLQKTDEEIAQNEYRIRAYEGMVWDNMKGLVGNMAAQLISNTLLHEKNAQGNSLVTLRNSLPTAEENISELLSMDRITIQNNYSQKFVCSDMNSLDSCTATMIVPGGMCQGPTAKTVKITEIESIVRPEYDDGFSKFFQSSEITAPVVTGWSGGTDIFGNGIGTPLQSERNYILHYNTYQTYRDRLNRPGELMYEFISKMYTELQKPPEERSLTAAAEAVSLYLTEQKRETDNMTAFWNSKIYTDISLANDSTYRFVYNTFKEGEYFNHSFVKDIEILYRLQENQKKLETFVSGNVTLAYGFSEQNMDTVRGNMPGIYDSSIQPLYADSVKMPYLRADYQKTYSISERETALLENSAAIQSVMDRIKASLKTVNPADNIEIDYINPLMNLHASSANLFSDWYVTGHERVGGNLRTDGLNYRRYRTNFMIDAAAEIGGLDYRNDSEENIWVEIKYRIKDKNAEANWLQWVNFQTDVNAQTVLWGSQMNAVQNWTVQSANFRNRASLWNQEKQNLQSEIQSNYNKSIEDLMSEKSSWLADMDSVRSKAVSGNFNAEIPSLPLLSYEKGIEAMQEKADQFQNTQNPDYSSFERFASVLDDTMNGFLNLLTAKNITDSAISTSSSALNSMALMLSEQKTMVDANEVLPEKRKDYYEAVKEFSDGGMCTGDGYEKNRQVCQGIYDGPFFKKQYASVELKNSQIEVTVLEKTGRVFLKEGGDSKDPNDYVHETVKRTYYINTPGEAKIADMSSLGGVFEGGWSSKTEGWQNSKKKEFGSDLAQYWQYWTDTPQENKEETSDPGPVQEEKKTLLSSVYDQVNKNSAEYLSYFYINTGTAEKPSYSYNSNSIFAKMLSSMSSRESENSQHFSNLARENSQQEASKAEMLESLAMAVVTGGLSQRNLSSWLKDRMTQAVKGKWAESLANAMCPGDSTKAKEPCQASEIAMAMLNARTDKDKREKAEKEYYRNTYHFPAVSDTMHSLSNTPVIKEFIKPMTVFFSNAQAEIINFASGAISITGNISQDITKRFNPALAKRIKKIQKENKKFLKEESDKARGKHFQKDMNAGKTDYKSETKEMIKEEFYKYLASLLAPAMPGIRLNDIVKLLKYDQQRRESARREKENARKRQELTAQIAAAAVLTFVPGAQASVGSFFSNIVSALESVPYLGDFITGLKWIVQGGAEYMTEFGSYLQSSIGITSSETAAASAVNASQSLGAQALNSFSTVSALTSGASAAAHGNGEGVLAAAVNAVLFSFTGPAGGFAGHVSYTPPEKTDLLTGLLNKIDGAERPTSGWGGGFSLGGSIFNAGLSFTPGSGASVDLGFSNGGKWNKSLFGNISYNINSGHTNGSVGWGQEYGTNLSANFSTDEAPSYTLSFGCDMQGQNGTGTNCGGGNINQYGLGGSLTFSENGIDAGFDILGNSFMNSSYDRESGTWSDPQFDENWAYSVQQMSSQDLADQEISRSARKTVFDEHYRKLLENDPSIAERLQGFLDGRKPGEDEYTALQNFYQENRELAAADGFNLPFDNKNSDSSLADAVYNASQIFLGALGISAVGLGILNRTGAGTGGSPSPDPRSPIPETARRREEGEGGEAGGEGGENERNPNQVDYDTLKDYGVQSGSVNTLSYEEEHRLEDAKAVINDLNKNGIGITAALQQAVYKIPDGPDAEKQRKLLIDAAVQMQISNVTDLNKMKDLLTANENSGGLYEPEDLKKVAEALLMKQKTLADVMTVGPALEKLLWNSGADTSEFWKTAAATALKKIESGSPIPKDFISSSVFRDMPEDAKAGLQNIAVNAELKQDFSKQLSNLKKQNLDAFLAGYDKLNSVALERADRVPTAGSDLDKALADKAGASLENTMKLKGTDAAKLAKEKILASLGNSPSAQAAVETRFKDVEQNYLKEKAVSEMLKAKSGLELADRYNDVMARENLDPGTKQALKESFSTISGNVLYSLYKTGGTEAAEKFINEIRNSSQDMHTDIGIKMQEKLGKLLIENSAKTGEGTLQNLNEAVNRLKNDTDFKNLSPSEQADAVNRLTSAAEDRILSMARETAGKGDSDTNVNAVKELRDAMKNSSEYKFSEQKINELENVFKKAEARNTILTKFESFANLDSKRIDTIKLEETKKIAAEFLVADQLKKNRELLIDSLKSLPKEDADIRDRVAKNEQNERKALENIAKKVDSKLEYLNLQVQSGGLLGNSDPYSIMDKNLSNLVKDSLISYSSDGQNATLNEKELQRLFPKKEDADAVKKMMESGDPKIAETVYSKLDPKLIAETAALLKNDSRFDSLKGLDPNSAGYKNLLVSIALEKRIVNSEKSKILKDRTALQNKMSLMEKDLKTMFKTDAKGELIYENGVPVEDPEKIAELEKKKADEFAASQQKKINDLKIAAAAESEINRLTAIPPEKRPDNYDSELKFWTDMKNQYDFSPSNVPVNDIKVQLEVQRKELTKQINLLGDGIDVAPNHLLLQNGKPIEDLGKRKEILDKLYQSLKGSPNADLAKMMAVNTIEKTALNINGTVVERQKVTVYGQEIYMDVNPSNTQQMLGSTAGQLWLNLANAIKDSGLKTISINHVNYDPGGSGTHGIGSAVDIGYVIDQNGKAYSAVVDKNANITRDQSYPDAIRALDNAFIRQNGSGNMWTPWQMYDGNGTPAYENRLWQWKSSPEWNKFKSLMEGPRTKENAYDIIKLHNDLGLKPPMGTDYNVFRQDIGHLDHLHYNVNTDEKLREFRQWKKL